MNAVWGEDRGGTDRADSRGQGSVITEPDLGTAPPFPSLRWHFLTLTQAALMSQIPGQRRGKSCRTTGFRFHKSVNCSWFQGIPSL